YGGNGKSNFALPNLQGSSPLHPGQGPGLSLYDLGESGGSATVSLLESEMPAHPHSLMCENSFNGSDNLPTPNVYARAAAGLSAYFPKPSSGNVPLVHMNPAAIGVNGGNLPHNNMMPFLTLNFCISLQGVYPPRS